MSGTEGSSLEAGITGDTCHRGTVQRVDDVVAISGNRLAEGNLKAGAMADL